MLSRRTVGSVVLVLLGIAGCSNGSTTSTTTSALDPATMKTYFARNVANLSIVTEAIGRIVTAASGGSAAGVTFTDIPGGMQGSVGVDLDHNGSMESSIDAKLMYNDPAVGLASGARITVTKINAPYVSGTFSANVAVNANGSLVSITSGTADLTPTYGPHITIPSASLTVTPTLQNPTILGHVDFAADNKTGTVFFEADGNGGWKVRVASPDFTGFTVP